MNSSGKDVSDELEHRDLFTCIYKLCFRAWFWMRQFIRIANQYSHKDFVCIFLSCLCACSIRIIPRNRMTFKFYVIGWFLHWSNALTFDYPASPLFKKSARPYWDTLQKDIEKKLWYDFSWDTQNTNICRLTSHVLVDRIPYGAP